MNDDLILNALPADSLKNYLCDQGMGGYRALKERSRLNNALKAWRAIISARYGWEARVDASERHLVEIFGREEL
jgi:hypothetical protein